MPEDKEPHFLFDGDTGGNFELTNRGREVIEYRKREADLKDMIDLAETLKATLSIIGVDGIDLSDVDGFEQITLSFDDLPLNTDTLELDDYHQRIVKIKASVDPYVDQFLEGSSGIKIKNASSVISFVDAFLLRAVYEQVMLAEKLDNPPKKFRYYNSQDPRSGAE